MFSWKGKDLGELDANKVKRNVPAYAILALAVGAMTFFGVCEPTGNRMLGPTGIAAKVDDTDVTALEFRRAHINRTQQAQQQYRDNFDPVQLGISQSVVNGLVEQIILYKEATRNGLYASEDEVAKVIIDGEYFSNEDGKFDPKLFKRYLRSQQHSEASFTEELRRNIVNSKLRNFVTNTYRVSGQAAKIDKVLADTKLNVDFLALDQSAVKIKVSDADIEAFLKDGGEDKARKYFEQNGSEFNKEAQVKARHVLVAFKGARRATGEAAKRTKEDAKKRAEMVLKEAKSGNFVAIAKKYTDEPSGKTKGGDLGFFKKADMVPEFSEVAFKLKKGEISGLVESPFGFHIIKVEDIRKGKNTSFDDAKKGIASNLISKDKKPEQAKKAADELLAAVKSGSEKSKLKTYDLAWKNTGEFALNARFIPGGLGSDAKIREAVLGLKKNGQIHDGVVQVGNVYYVLKLKSRQDVDLEKLEKSELKELADSGRFLEAYWMYNKLSAQLKKKYEDEKRVFKNQEFMQYDAIVKAQSGS